MLPRRSRQVLPTVHRAVDPELGGLGGLGGHLNPSGDQVTHPWRRPWLDCCGARNQDSGRARLPQILDLTASSRGGTQEPNQVPDPVGATNADTGRA